MWVRAGIEGVERNRRENGIEIWSGARLHCYCRLIAGWAGAALAAPAARAQEELVFCSDIAYPPMESYEGSEAVGADIDIGNEIAARLDERRSTPISGSTASSPRSSATSAKRSSRA